jgi:hypothetical protein
VLGTPGERRLKKQNPTAVSDLLAKGQGVLERLREGGRQAASALEAVRAELPEEEAAHVCAATLRGETLTVRVDSAAWATRIRYGSPGLAEAVGRRLGATLKRAVVRVGPAGQAGAVAST